MLKIFQKNRPHLSMGSIKTYMSVLRSLGREIHIPIDTPEDIVNNKDKILDYFKDMNYKTRKTRLAGLIVYIEGLKDEKSKEVVNEFKKIMMKDGEAYQTELSTQTLSDKQKDGWIDWNEVLEQYKQLEKEVSYYKTSTNLNKNQFRRVELYVLLSCLVLIPPRRSTDYTMFKIRNEDNEHNYMEVKGKKAYFVFNVYKTAKRYGQEKVEIPNTLKKIIQRWKEINSSDYLLLNTKMNKPINTTQLNGMLNDYFNKPLSTSLLRHIYLTNKYKDIPALQDMQKTAEEMGHSVPQALEYIKKV